jgi:plastocyanin
MESRNIIYILTLVLSTLILSSLWDSGILNWLPRKLALAANGKDASTISKATQLSTKEIKDGVYNWISGSNGASNPPLRVILNVNNTIKIKNPTDTKHELIIDSGTDVLPSSGDINPNSSGQLSFTPNAIGTFTYHCAYHPYTMKGIVQVVTGK